MIVTRRRRKPFPWKRLILPVIAIALVAVAIVWAPSRNVITGGPMAPMMQKAGSTFDNVAAPFHFAAQNQLLTDRNRQIVQLQSQVTDLQSQVAAKDKQISSLNGQVAQLQAQAAATRADTPAPAAPAQSGAQTTAGDSSAGIGTTTDSQTQTLRRTASYWANMEPDNAAKVIEKLPPPYVARVLAMMSADDAGAILDALPAAYAAQLTQENPQLRR